MREINRNSIDNRNCIFLFKNSNKNIESKSFVQVDKINIH